MDENERPSLSPLGAGFLRLWTEMQIREGRKINAATLAREASGDGAPVQAGAPWAIVEQKGYYSPLELSRLLAYLGETSLERVEDLGR